MSRRWWVLVGAVAVQVSIGGVYAWSVMARALADPRAMGLSGVEAAVPFEVAIGLIVVGAFVGGRWQDRRGPRVVALVGVTVYAAGVLVSSLATSRADLWILVVGYGVLGGFGLGLAYIVPIAMLQKWFPDKAALVTGLAVGGFGFGAVLTSPLAQALIGRDPTRPTAAFVVLGLVYLALGVSGAATFANPPTSRSEVASEGMTMRQALSTRDWYLLTATLAASVFAGISLISVASSSMVDIAGLTPVAAAAAVGALGLFNGAGRIVWAWASDRLGKTRTLALILVCQGVSLVALPHATSAAVFLVLAAVIYTCYGGTFGVLPSTAGRFFGLRHVGAIYGLMLIGWSVGGVVGPLVIAVLHGSQGWTTAYTIVGAIAVVAAVLPLAARPRPT